MREADSRQKPARGRGLAELLGSSMGSPQTSQSLWGGSLPVPTIQIRLIIQSAQSLLAGPRSTSTSRPVPAKRARERPARGARRSRACYSLDSGFGIGLATFRETANARPRSPVPSRSKEPGSGTGLKTGSPSGLAESITALLLSYEPLSAK